MKKQIIVLAVACSCVLGIAAFLSSCSDDPKSSTDNFDRAALLQHYAEDLIIPAYTSLLTSVTTLEDDATAFTENPGSETLTTVQASWEEAFLRWQSANAYNFGLAGESGIKKSLADEIGLFPVSTTKIESAITSGTYDLNDAKRDARGFLAIEYLLFSLNDDNESIVASFESTNRQAYLLDVIANLKQRIAAVQSDWTGSYKSEFVASTGTAVGSSTSELYNEFVRSYEVMKNFKVAFPLGLGAGQTHTRPEDVEAYYSGKSIRFLKAHYTALEKIWYGKGQNDVDGIGFKEYLESVEGGAALVSQTEAQFAKIREALATLEETPRLSTQIETNFTALSAMSTELQKNVRYIKSDMSSLLGIAITFSSADGD